MYSGNFLDSTVFSDGLNENDLQRLRNLKTWSPIGGTVRVDLEGVALLEEVLGGGDRGGLVFLVSSFSASCLWFKM